MPTEIEIDPSDLEAGIGELTAALDDELHRSLAISADMVEREAKLIAPRRTGALHDSIRATPPTGSFASGTLESGVQADAPHASPVHDGSRPHVIRPIYGRALAFPVGGQMVFARRVNHPGNAPQPFLDHALESRAEDVLGELGDAHDRALERTGFQ